MGFFFSLLMLSFLNIVPVKATSFVEEPYISEAQRFVSLEFLNPVLDRIQETGDKEKMIFMKIFNHHANADPFSKDSPFYQFKDKQALIREIHQLTSLIASALERYTHLLFDYLYIIATFGGQSILKDETHEFYQDYKYFLKEIATYENKNPVDFIALCLKMGILLTPKNIVVDGNASPPFDKVFTTIKTNFYETHSNSNDLTRVLLEKTKTEGTTYEREFASIHGIAKHFQDFIPLPFMGDLDAGDIARSTPNFFNKLWLSGIPVNPVLSKLIDEESDRYVNGYYADVSVLLSDVFLLHDWLHLSFFKTSFYVRENIFSNIDQTVQDKNFLIIQKIQEWMDIEDPQIDRKLKEFMAFYLLHENVLCDPFYDTFQNHLRYYHLLSQHQLLIDPHYYAPLLPPELVELLKADTHGVRQIFDPVYMDLRRFVSKDFPLKKNYISPFMRSIDKAYTDDFSASENSAITLSGPDEQRFMLNDEIFIKVMGSDIVDLNEFTELLLSLLSDNTNLEDQILTYADIAVVCSNGASLNHPDFITLALGHENYDVAAELILRGAPNTEEQFESMRGKSLLMRTMQGVKTY